MSVATEITDQRLTNLIEAEQADFVSLARSLTPEQWSEASLCKGWSVRDVVIHAAGHSHGNKKGRTERQRRRGMSTEEIVDWLDGPVVTMHFLRNFDAQVQLAELMIHQQDVRRPLCLPREIASERLDAVLSFCLGRLGSVATAGLRRRARGLRFEASDTTWAHGEGPAVTGPAEVILMALSGRAATHRELSGPGLSILTPRLGR